ncbi:hypothetical protein BH23BAC1_BH23BAC1_27940 [soil metagenome]
MGYRKLKFSQNMSQTSPIIIGNILHLVAVIKINYLNYTYNLSPITNYLYNQLPK